MAQDVLDGRRLEQSLEHATGASMLQALVGCQGVLGAIAPVAEFAHIQRVRLLVLVLEVPLKRVVARERSPAVRTLLRLVYPAGSGGRHPIRYACNTDTSPSANHTSLRLQLIATTWIITIEINTRSSSRPSHPK